MAEPVVTMDGWCTLHDTRTFDWPAWKLTSEGERQAAVQEFKEIMEKWNAVEAEKEGSQVLYKVIGNKADLLFVFMRPTMDELEEIKREINKSKLGDYLIPAYSYVSIVEMTLHNPMQEGKDREYNRGVDARLKPTLPKWEYICFYPMARRREIHANWFEISKAERTRLLYEHGMTGRKYAGKIREFISGSIGLDEWEWCVTLFAHDPLQFKKIVYEMRFDEVTTKFAEFGDFIIGAHLSDEHFAGYFEL